MMFDDSRAPLRVIHQVAISAVTAILVSASPVFVYLRNGAQGLFSYVQGDALLYIAIARHSAKAPHYTFDGETVTNGFHPLWQYFLTYVFKIVGPETLEAEHLLSLFLSTASMSLGLILTNLAIYRYTRSIFLSLLTIPGIYYMITGVIFRNQPVWERIDGMESSFSVLFGGALLFLFAYRLAGDKAVPLEDLAKPKWSNVLVQGGLILPFIILSRLDDVFILPAFALLMLLLPGSWPDRIKTTVLIGLPSVLAVLGYMAYNKLTVGVPMPLSGMTKSGVSLLSALYVYLAAVFPPLIELKEAITGDSPSGPMLMTQVFRAVQVVVPAFIGLAYAVLVKKYFKNNARFVVPVGFSFYVVIKASYNFIMVNLWHQGPWYYALFMLMSSFWFAILVGDAYSRLVKDQVFVARLLQAAWLNFMLFSLGSHMMYYAYGDRASRQSALCNNREQISQSLAEKAPGSNLIEFDDGVLNFCLDQLAIHGFAFATDKASFEAFKNSQLLHHAHRRGYDILAAAAYIQTPEWLDSSDQIRDSLSASFLDANVKNELNSVDFKMLYLDKDSQTGFFQFWPKGSSPPAEVSE